MTVCKFCGLDDDFKTISNEAIIIENSKLFNGDICFELQIYGDELGFCFYSNGEIFLDKFVKIKYCPMCGRELKSE